MTTILLSAGDASGEAHAADLVRALRTGMPTARFLGLGGPEMEAAGVELIADSRRLAVGGFLEIIGSLGRIVASWREVTRALRECQPDLVVLVDSGGFNVPLARYVRAHSKAQVLYYIAPQLWAWRSGRLRKLVARTDRIAVLFPFELDFYRDHGVEVDFVGHPILDSGFAEPVGPETRARARRALDVDSKTPILGVLPGSRRNEVARHLPLQLKAFAKLRNEVPGLADLEAIVGLAPSLEAEWVRRLARESGIAGPIRFEPGNQTLFDAVDVAVAKPGTLTVELMLRERPMVVIGRAQPLTEAIVRRAVRVPWLAMPNLIAGEEIVPELLQGDATPDRIAAALAPLFPDRTESSFAEADSPSLAGREQIKALRRARSRLGIPGASARVAALVEEMLGSGSSSSA